MDSILFCIACRSEFVFTDREREFLEGLHREGQIPEVRTPRRCLSCRRESRRPRGAPARPAPRPPRAPAVPENGNGHGEVPELLLMGAGDFERLVTRLEVVLGGRGPRVRIKLADIGLPVIKEIMDRAVLKWWRS